MRIIWIVVMVIVLGMMPGARVARAEGGGLDGVWLVKDAMMGGIGQVSRVWKSTLIVREGRFELTHYCGAKVGWKGRVALGVEGNAQAVDLAVEGLDMSEIWEGVKYPACVVKGIYEVKGEELRLCVRTGPKFERPVEFKSEDVGTLLVTFVRAREGFRDFPKDVRVKVVDTEGKGVAGANMFLHAVYSRLESDSGEWKYYPLKGNVTGADGTATWPYEKLDQLAAGARDAEGKRVGYTAVSPGMAQDGTATVVLYPPCHVSGVFECDELAKAGKPLGRIYIMVFKEGMNAIDFRSSGKDFFFDVPPGEYLLHIYGGDINGKEVKMSVGSGDREVKIPTVKLEASPLAILKGRTAPELEGVTDWRGGAVKLADLRGKVVLMNFWGYWCGNCIEEMPTMMTLDEKFRDKGLVVMGVHYDTLGEVDTAAKLEGKMAGLRKFWEGKDIGFPVAVIGGNKGGAVEQYGIESFPTTVLIDRDGKVVGQFQAQDEKDAVKQVEALLRK